MSKLHLRNKLPTLLSFIGVSGVAATAVMAVKATPKALYILEKKKEELNRKLTVPETVKAAFPVYIPSALMGLATMSCIAGANVLNVKKQTALISAQYLTSNMFKEYRDKTEDIFGEGTDLQVKEAIAKDNCAPGCYDAANGKLLFYEEYSKRFFEATEKDVILAEYHFNRNFAIRGYANLNEFYEFLGLEPTEEGKVLGWSFEAGYNFYGYQWVDFEHTSFTSVYGTDCYLIYMPFEPTADYNN